MSFRKGPQPAPFIDRLDVYSVPQAPAPTDLILDSNEGAAPPHSLIDNIARENPALFHRYLKTDGLERLIAAQYDIDPEQVIVTAGCDDAIQRCCRIYLSPDREMILPYPTFTMYRKFATLAGGTIVDVSWTNDYFPVDETLEAVTDKTGIITVISPNNPTGKIATPEDLQRLSEGAPNVLILVDLAYTQFADVDLTATVLQLPNAIALHTFSKAWGMAGLRVGFATGPKKMIHYLRRAGLPFPVANISAALVEKWIDSGREHLDGYVAQVRSERERLQKHIEKLGGETTASQGNFVFAGFADPVWIRDALAGFGIAVRLISAKDDFPGGLRITCPGNEKSYRRLEKAFDVVMKPQAILFDMDGVIADDSRSYRQAIIDTAKTYGVELTIDDVAAEKAKGNANNEWIVTQRMLAAHGVDVDLEEVTARYEEIYQGTETQPGLWSTESILIDKAWLANLSKHILLGIVTGRPRHDAERFLQQHGISDLFQEKVCMEEAPLKPDPAPVRLCLEKLGVERAWMIGDTPDDIRAGCRAGALSLGIVSPADERKTAQPAMYQAGAARVLYNLTEMEEILP